MLFYDCSTAPSPRRARMFIAEKGIKIESKDISMLKGEQLSAEFLSVNPRGTIPVLMTDQGSVLTENLSIAAYLEEIFPKNPLMGTTADERALVLMWNAICETQGGQAVADAFRNSNPHMKGRALTGPVNFEQIPELAERAFVRVELFFDLLEKRLSENRYIAADTFTLVDITAFVFCDFARVIKKRVNEDHPSLLAWYEGMKTRPSASL